MLLNVEIALRLKTIRIKAQLSQKQFAARLGTSQQRISKYEGGVMPGIVVLLRLHKKFGVDLNVFVAGVDNGQLIMDN